MLSIYVWLLYRVAVFDKIGIIQITKHIISNRCNLPQHLCIQVQKVELISSSSQRIKKYIICKFVIDAIEGKSNTVIWRERCARIFRDTYKEI